MIKGHLEITKIYKDGTKELVLDDHNLITKGLGQTYLDLQTNRGSTFVEDYAPRYFQVGTASAVFLAADTSAYIYGLSAPFDWDDYGPDTEITVEKAYRGFNASSDDGTTYAEWDQGDTSSVSATTLSGTDEYFGVTTPTQVSKSFLDSFAVEIILDENSGNGKSIKEVGLFSRNPRGLPYDSPWLIAYKQFEAVAKTSEFSLVIHWQIGFVGVSNTVDVWSSHGSPGPPYRGTELK
jgi:hypothetical protein